VLHKTSRPKLAYDSDFVLLNKAYAEEIALEKVKKIQEKGVEMRERQIEAQAKKQELYQIKMTQKLQ